MNPTNPTIGSAASVQWQSSIPLCVIPAVSLPLQAGEPGPRGPWGDLLQLRGTHRRAPFAGKHRDRQVGVGKQLVSAMGAARDDKDGRQDGVMRGFRPFDAPVCIIVTYDRDLHGMDDAPFDCGAPPWSTPPGREAWAQWSTARASCARPSCARSPTSPSTHPANTAVTSGQVFGGMARLNSSSRSLTSSMPSSVKARVPSSSSTP